MPYALTELQRQIDKGKVAEIGNHPGAVECLAGAREELAKGIRCWGGENYNRVAEHAYHTMVKVGRRSLPSSSDSPGTRSRCRSFTATSAWDSTQEAW